MPETGATYVPRPLTDIDSDPLTEALEAIVGLGTGRVVYGLDLTYDSLTAHIAAGRAVVVTDANARSAYYIKLTASVDKTLVNNATNYLYLNATADIVVNQTGITPADAIPLFSIVTSGGVVSGTPIDLRSTVVNIGFVLKALGLNLSNGELTNLGAPGSASSGARLQDVLDAFAGVGGIKNPVRAATTAPITLSGLQTVDGVALNSNDRVLDKNNATQSARGIYIAQSGAWVRATDFDSSAELVPGTLVTVSEGAVNGGSLYGLDTPAPILLGTTSLTFTRKDVQAHAALTTAHGAVSAPTPSLIIIRDAQGRAKVVDGAAADDIATKGQMDTAVASEASTRSSADSAESAARAAADSAESTARINGDAAAVATAEAYAIQRANHTGTQLASTVSNFDAQVRTSRLDQMAVPTADVSMGNKKLTNVAPPVAQADAARLGDIGGLVVSKLAPTFSMGAAASLSPYPTTATGMAGGVLACAKSGANIWMFFQDNADADIKVVKSTDSGATWGSSVTVAAETLAVNGHSKAFALSSTILVLLYKDPDDNRVKARRSTDSGATWASEQDLFGAGAVGDVFDAHATSSGSALWVAVFHASTIEYARSTNQGSSYTTGSVVSSGPSKTTTNHFIVARDDQEANIIFSVASGAGVIATPGVYSMRTTNGGSSWTPITITATDSGLYVVACNESGNYAVFADDGTNTSLGKCYTSTDGGATWTSHDVSRNIVVGGNQGFFGSSGPAALAVARDPLNGLTHYLADEMIRQNVNHSAEGLVHVTVSAKGVLSYEAAAQAVEDNGFNYINFNGTVDGDGRVLFAAQQSGAKKPIVMMSRLVPVVN